MDETQIKKEAKEHGIAGTDTILTDALVETLEKESKVKILKDWVINCNTDHIVLIEGEYLPKDFPKKYLQNLKTEQIIK